MPVTLAAVALVHLVTAAAFVAVAERFRRRKVEPGMDHARNAYIAWWWGFAVYVGLQGLADLVAALGVATVPMVTAQRVVTGPVVAVACWGLAYHVFFLWSGKRWLARPLAVYYAITGVAYSTWVIMHDPQAIVVTPWAVDLEYAAPLEGAVWTLIIASLTLPLLSGSIAYVLLARRVEGRDQRYRIALVGGSILLWVVSAFTAQAVGGGIARFVVIVVLGLPTAAALLLAYFPPAPIRRWLEKDEPDGTHGGMQAKPALPF